MSPAPYSTQEICQWIDSFEHAIAVTRDGQILAANAALLAVMGRPLEEIAGREFFHLLPEDEHARMRDGAAALRSLGAPARIAISAILGSSGGVGFPSAHSSSRWSPASR